jgi:hypothetical protein
MTKVALRQKVKAPDQWPDGVNKLGVPKAEYANTRYAIELMATVRWDVFSQRMIINEFRVYRVNVIDYSF